MALPAHCLILLVEGREDPLRVDLLQAGHRVPHHEVVPPSGVVGVVIMKPGAALPGADHHPASLVVGEAVVAHCRVDVGGLGIEPGLVSEIDFDIS